MLRDMAKGRVTLVGAGNLAGALATMLPKAGYELDEIVTRQESRGTRFARGLARQYGGRHVSIDKAKFASGITWLAVSDSAIRSCAGDLASKATWKNKVVLHSSGALSSDELSALRKRGASVASVHPMMTFVPGEIPDLEGVAWTVEGDARAIRVASQAVRGLGGTVVRIEKDKKPLYHAFGAFLSPLLVVHLDRAAEVATAAGISRKDVSRFMEPIVRRTLDNLFTHVAEKNGAGRAFSGPLVRGDVSTIERHLKALRKTPGARKIYRALVEAAVESDLPVKSRGAIRRLLRSRG
jgi:predicted short-subunit dehydrogenase-like oxidoreductase (DUF2520 family)